MIITTQFGFWGQGYVRDVWIGILDYLTEHPGVRLYPGDTDVLTQAAAPYVVDGVIGALPDGGPAGMPAVDVFLCEAGTTPRVGTDNRSVSRLAFDHFRSLGLRNLAVLDAEKFHDIRGEPFVEVCREHGFIPQVFPVGPWTDTGVPASERARLAR